MDLLQSAARDIYVFMASSTDHITGITGLGSGLTVTMGKNGGALSSISPTVTERSNGWYTLSLTASHTDTLGELGFHVTGSGCDPSDFKHVVVAYNAFDGAYLGLTGIDDLETRITAARAGYIDNLSAGAVALASVCTEARLSELAAANLPADVDTLLSRLTSLRAGYLDNLSAGAVALASVCTSARLGELDAANLPTDISNVYTRIGAPAGASIAADLVVIDNFVDDLEGRITSTRAGYLDNLSAGAVALASVCTEARLGELAAANIPADVDTLLARITSTRAAYFDELGPTNIPADVDTLISRLTSARAGYLDELAAANIPADIDTLLTRITSTRAGYLDNLAGGAVALASELSKVLGASAGRKVISADGLQVEVYDESDTLLVTLDRTGAGPYTWTPTWE